MPLLEENKVKYRYKLSDANRKLACKSPEDAYYYARDIDKCPRDDTRESACKNPVCAYLYAHKVDKCSRNDTRKSACVNP